jgi:homoserine dehydrogenase
VSPDVIVLKFGSSVLRSEADLPAVGHEIYRWTRAGYRVIAVVSAMGKATDDLLAQAARLTSSPAPFATAELLATGERVSAALLGIALDRAGILARVLNPREIGLTVAGDPLDSELSSVDVGRLRQQLRDYPVLIVPGFFGTDEAGRTHLLGRGGSDLTAVFLAAQLGGRCRLLKDVDGVYDSDPSVPRAGRMQRRFETLSYRDALRVAGRLIQPKAVRYLQEQGASVEVAALTRGFESKVQNGESRYAGSLSERPPMKTVLLGLGTVGLGVYQRLLANPDHFVVTGCLVRNRAKYESIVVSSDRIYTDPARVQELCKDCDLVIDALPGTEPSQELISWFSLRGAHVVSANKTVIAAHGTALKARGSEAGGSLRYSAAVGGAAPFLELVERVASQRAIASVAAVLNGTCNFMADRCGSGGEYAAAIEDAQAKGFAEADPADDLSGRDAERKLRILCQHAWGRAPKTILLVPFDEEVARLAKAVAERGERLRQVARAALDEGDLRAQVTFEAVKSASLFGSLNREWNGLQVTDSAGEIHSVTGRGAGRWPTTEAVMADLFDLHREVTA